MQPRDKFLVQLVDIFTRKHVFFLVWAAIVGIFSLLMISHYRKNTRRNFRQSGDPSTTKLGFNPRLPRSGAAGDKRNGVR